MNGIKTVITVADKAYQCYGNAINVWPDLDLGDRLNKSYITHNHPADEILYSFSRADLHLFKKYQLQRLRGIDDKYVYELDVNRTPSLGMPTNFNVEYGYEHIQAIQYLIENNIYYMRWKND